MNQKRYDIWQDRKKSLLVKRFIEESCLNGKDVAKLLGYTKQYFDNKLQRNSFSFEDILTIADLCGYNMIFESRDDSKEEMRIDAYDFRSKRSEEARNAWLDLKRAEYEKKKEELKSIAKEYGFEEE